VRDLAGVEDVLLSFAHDTAPFCGIGCAQTHAERGVRSGDELRGSWRTYRLRRRDRDRQWPGFNKSGICASLEK